MRTTLILASMLTIGTPLFLHAAARQDVPAPTTEDQVRTVLGAVGAVDISTIQARSLPRHLAAENENYAIWMYEQRGQLDLFTRRPGYYRDHPFDAGKPDLIRSDEDARKRVFRFVQEAGLDWGPMKVNKVTRVNEALSASYLHSESRRLYEVELWETSADPRRTFHTLRRSRILVDAQYGHILRAFASYTPPEGPWRISVSESAARDTVLSAWRQAGHVFHADQTTVSARWILPRFGTAYRCDDRLLAGWVIEVKQKPTDENILAFAWVHGETGKLVHLHGPFPPPSTGE